MKILLIRGIRWVHFLCLAESCVTAKLQVRNYPTLWAVKVREIEQAMRASWVNGCNLTEISFKNILAFNSNFIWLSSILKTSFFYMAISNNQSSCKIKNVASTTHRSTMAIWGDSLTSKNSADYFGPFFRSWLFSVSSNKLFGNNFLWMLLILNFMNVIVFYGYHLYT